MSSRRNLSLTILLAGILVQPMVASTHCLPLYAASSTGEPRLFSVQDTNCEVHARESPAVVTPAYPVSDVNQFGEIHYILVVAGATTQQSRNFRLRTAERTIRTAAIDRPARKEKI